ncbi:histidine phosphatase family protein [Marinobacter sp. M216]|uniref:Histidine phosphatase family protein n=1 Tax=Marinobacter albus TaxID=3030833 RepID=A0ABT7HFV7_9GAMM|nr:MULTISPECIES: histidine phosphatase family protein [unclassified Marinobacter]MBW7472706.1 histidine phosphatase family protein [Marinobacter sp. F4218]MDK9559259.1 histidine phosphatase family protein [Marinobacter sp. M216]
MATVYLVRHGQASFGKANYDQLSPTGWEQGRSLGRWLVGKVTPDAVFGGNLERHRETVEAIATGYGSQLPDMQVVPGFNEFDHNEVVTRFRPAWSDRTVMARDLQSFPKPARAFQEAFVQAVRRWASGEHDHEYDETWPDFKARVLQAFDEMIEFADGGDVLVATSGGPISVICQHLLELDDKRALALNEVIANTSVSRVLYSGPRRSLSVFNNYSHLEAEDPALVTFR